MSRANRRSPEYRPNPRRQAAGRLNVQRRRGLTEGGRERLRAAAHRHRPWEHSTGPRTPEGKERSAANGRQAGRRRDPASDARYDVLGLTRLLVEMAATRRRLAEVAEQLGPGIGELDGRTGPARAGEDDHGR